MGERWINDFCFKTSTAFTDVGPFERTIFASGPLVNKRSKTERGLTPDGLGGAIAGHDGGLTGMNKGHLIALSLGGPNIPENVVPMFAYFNKMGDWKAMEREIVSSGYYAGRYLTIEILYQADAPYLPSQFGVSLTDTMPKITGSPQRVLVMQRRATAPHEVYADLNDLVRGVMTEADYKGKDYAFLDNHRAKLGVSAIKQTAKFDARQREILKTVNAIRSHYNNFKGILTSDDADDLHRFLNNYGDDDFPEVDHLIPLSNGGTNAFGNARLISHKSNNSRRAQVTPQQAAAIAAQGQDFRDGRPRRGVADYSTRS